MNNKILIPIAVVVAIALIALLYYTSSEKESLSTMDFSYDSNFNIQSILAENDISMSNPLKIKGNSVDQYCKFFSDDSFQKSIQYCTSTELTDSDGQFVGNIHMVGDNDHPFAVLGIIQTDPFFTELDSVKLVSNAMIVSLVCDCWNEKKPGGFETVSAWIDAAKSHHLEAKKITSKSEIDGLAKKKMVIEITTNTEGYLWKFIVTN